MKSMPNQQLRNNLPSPWLTRLRVMRHRIRGARIETGATVFPSVQLLRHPANIRIGADAIIKSGAHLCPCNDKASVHIGARTSIGFHTFVYASSSVTIGSDCMIAPFVYVVDSDHGIAKGIPMNQQENIVRPIAIGDDVWIGAHSVILAGVTISDGAVVAAGAVVREDVPSNAIVGGVPARILGERQ